MKKTKKLLAILLTLALVLSFTSVFAFAAKKPKTYSKYDINKDGKISSADYLFLKNHVLGRYTIKQDQ